MNDLAEKVKDLDRLFVDLRTEVFVYAGEMTANGTSVLCKQISQSRESGFDRALLLLATVGGDAHAAYRLARRFQADFKNFSVLVPGLCKSAGTLVCVGAHELAIANDGELGPLDVQIRKRDELVQYGSALDQLKALELLRSEALAAFRHYLLEITGGTGVSMKTAADIARNLTVGLYSNAFAQLDPIQLGEISRAMNIAQEYGSRLSATASSMEQTALFRLIAGYPTHSFVIDREEAAKLFKNVREPSGAELGLVTVMQHLINKPDEEPTAFSLKALASRRGTGEIQADENDRRPAAGQHGVHEAGRPAPNQSGADGPNLRPDPEHAGAGDPATADAGSDHGTS